MGYGPRQRSTGLVYRTYQYEYSAPGSSVYLPQTYTLNSAGSTCGDYTHDRRLLGRSTTDIGHAMSVTHSLSGMEVPSVRSLSLKGTAPMQWPEGDSNPYNIPDQSNLTAAGATAISRTLPLNPAFDMATFIGELTSEGLPRAVSQAARRGPSGLPDDYLNYQFGWAPFVSGLQDFGRAVKNSREIISQYQRDSGRKIRRRFEFVPESTFSSVPATGDIGPGSLQGDIWRGYLEVTSTRRKWFSGAYRYYVPVPTDFLGRLDSYVAKADRLLGVRPTPSTVWELAPWSWAVDWFTNVGDVINNVSRLGQDGLVMQYGYIMETAELYAIARATSAEARRYISGSSMYPRFYPYQGVRTRRRVRKTRLRADPYGFGIDDTVLSAVQLSILAALGLSKGQRLK